MLAQVGEQHAEIHPGAAQPFFKHLTTGLVFAAQLAEFQKSLIQAASGGQSLSDASAYAVDAAQRLLLTLDVLRERGNNDKAHEDAGTPPVLNYDYDVIIDGRDLERPVNYQLLKILLLNY